MSRLQQYLEKIADNANIESGTKVLYDGKKYRVSSDEGDKLILKGVKGYVWKSECTVVDDEPKR